jgi:hypothetical protein
MQAGQTLLQQLGGPTSAATVAQSFSLNVAYQQALADLSATALQYKVLKARFCFLFFVWPSKSPLSLGATQAQANSQAQGSQQQALFSSVLGTCSTLDIDDVLAESSLAS